MAGKKLRLGAAGTLGALCVYAAPAFAQDGGVQTTFGISQSLDYGRNVTLDVPSAGDYAAAVTGLSFATSSETRIQSLSFGASADLQVARTDGETESDFTSPLLSLSYGRQAATSTFDVSATYQQREVDDVVSLSDFIDDDGVLDPDFDDLTSTGTGRQTNYGADAAIVLGIDRPLGFEFGLGVSGVDYEDTTDEDLTDQETRSARASARFDLTETFSTNVSLSYSEFEDDDVDETERVTQNISTGVVYEVSPRATVAASVGQTEIETTDIGGTTEVDGVTGAASLSYSMPNGAITASYAADLDIDGTRRQSVRLGRSMDLPVGALSYSIGASQAEGGDADLIGSVDWTQDLPTGQIRAQVDRLIGVDDEDETFVETVANVTYAYQINRVSGLSLGLAYALEEETTDSARVEQTDLSASYSRALTEDWDFTTGVGYRVRDEDGVGTAKSPTISLSIGREFTAIR